jgi:hypothetical protein
MEHVHGIPQRHVGQSERYERLRTEPRGRGQKQDARANSKTAIHDLQQRIAFRKGTSTPNSGCCSFMV